MLYLDEQCVILELQATTKEATLKELAGAIHSQCPQIELDTLGEVLRQRELVGSTGVGNGIAIPHGKLKGLNKILLCFARSNEGISFDAIDNRPVQLFVMILSPENMADEYLKTLARISRFLKDPENRRLLLKSESRQDIVELFNQQLRD